MCYILVEFVMEFFDESGRSVTHSPSIWRAESEIGSQFPAIRVASGLRMRRCEGAQSANFKIWRLNNTRGQTRWFKADGTVNKSISKNSRRLGNMLISAA